MKSKEKGQGLVEFALVIPVLAMLLLIMAIVGDNFRRVEALENAASEGGRAAQVYRPDGVTTCFQRVESAVQRITPIDVTVETSANCSATNVWARIPSGDHITVRVSHTWQEIFTSTFLLGPGEPPKVRTYTAEVIDRHE
ncbi:MAG: TadE/TadG family type IV pilus assembly protein [Microgenomates group bacterium]